MNSGSVKFFDATKGYGFIAPEGGGSDVFVHISAVERSGLTGLADDQKVSFVHVHICESLHRSGVWCID